VAIFYFKDFLKIWLSLKTRIRLVIWRKSC